MLQVSITYSSRASNAQKLLQLFVVSLLKQTAEQVFVRHTEIYNSITVFRKWQERTDFFAKRNENNLTANVDYWSFHMAVEMTCDRTFVMLLESGATYLKTLNVFKQTIRKHRYEIINKFFTHALMVLRKDPGNTVRRRHVNYRWWLGGAKYISNATWPHSIFAVGALNGHNQKPG